VTAKGEFVPRQSTGLRDWTAAEAYLADFNKQVVAEIVHGEEAITLKASTDKFTDAHETFVSKKVCDQYKLVLSRLVSYAKGQGVTFAGDVTYDLCVDFLTYGLTMASNNTKSTYQAKLKKFLDEAYKRGWIKKDIGAQIDNIVPEYEVGEPYDDDELRGSFHRVQDRAGRLRVRVASRQDFSSKHSFDINELIAAPHDRNGLDYDVERRELWSNVHGLDGFSLRRRLLLRSLHKIAAVCNAWNRRNDSIRSSGGACVPCWMP
jgi:hypothetical protein